LALVLCVISYGTQAPVAVRVLQHKLLYCFTFTMHINKTALVSTYFSSCWG